MKRTVINLAKEKSCGIDALKGTGVPAVRIGTMSASSEGRGAAGQIWRPLRTPASGAGGPLEVRERGVWAARSRGGRSQTALGAGWR